MLRDKIAALLQIHPEETRMVAWMATLFFLVQAGQGFGDTAAFALFVSHNVDRLPYMYVPLGVIVFLVSLVYSASLGRFQNATVVVWFLAGFVVLLLVEWAAIVLFQISITQFFWLTVNGMGVVLGTLLWTVAGEVCDARQAKRLFPFFTSIAILGSVIGNSLTGLLARVIGTNNLIVLFAIVLGGALWLLRNITRAYFKLEPPSRVAFNLIGDLRAGFDFVRQSGLFRLVAFSAVLYSVLFFTVDFPFSQFVSKNFMGDEVAVANFKGLFTSGMTLVTFFVSLLLANRLYAKLGIVNSILLMPITYLLGFAAFFVFFRFEAAASVRFVQQVMLGGVMGTAWSALFNVVPSERRGQVLAFINGVPAQIGVILSGLLLIVGSRVFSSTQQILVMGALVALLCLYFTWKMRDEYGNALISALRAGRVEVFSDAEEAFAGYQNDPTALQATFKALHDLRPNVRRLAAEMLSKMGSPMAIPDLVERLSDEDASVRAAAVKALADLDAKGISNQIVAGLDDVDDSVRDQALASLVKLEAGPSPELIHTLERLLDAPNSRISARAAVVLMYLGESEKADSLLRPMLNDVDETKRLAALEAYRAIALESKTVIPFNTALILNALNDPVSAVRRQALLVAGFFKEERLIESVAQHLEDADAGVRRAASESLKQAWPESRGVLLRILHESESIAASYALDAIPVGDVEVLDPMSSYIQREVSGIRYLRMLIDSLPSKGRMVKLLVDTLKHRISLIEERLVKAVGLFGNLRAMELVRRGLTAGNASARAAALEALETLGDKRITTQVLPILDRGGVFQAEAAGQRMTVNEIAGLLLTHKDRWLRAMGTYVVIEMDVEESVPEVRKMYNDKDPLVQDAARAAWSHRGGSVQMKTLKTLSTLDRVLLLREVPMFIGLSPEDLEQIAEIAEEQLFLDQAILCREGEYGHALFIIASGVVDVLKKSGTSEKMLASRSTGDFVGEMAILESAPRSATLRARGGVRTLVIDGDAFQTILLDRPQVAVSVLRRMSTRVRELNEKIGAGG
ncbi:MAG TPA: HEAT repeat domain-containing protein [Anaerolineales bacterium]|nr:HEAT repeat domain-containing protein [Anaerolineales bacterium]